MSFYVGNTNVAFLKILLDLENQVSLLGIRNNNNVLFWYQALLCIWLFILPLEMTLPLCVLPWE